MKRINRPLEQLLMRLRLQEPMEGWKAVDLWAEVAGERVASRTRAVGFRDGTLYVRVESAAWMNELTYLRLQFLRELNKRIGDDLVKEIRLQPEESDTGTPDRTGAR